MIQNVSTLWRPQVFQGEHKKGTYFEGWFYKIVDSSGEHTYAFIPGIFTSNNPRDTHAFVMVLDAATHLSTYHVYSVDQFRASSRQLDIQVGANRFCADFFEIHLDSEQRSVHGRIKLGHLQPWPVKLLSPGVMGWYAFVPFMECYHAVLSFDHTVQGYLTINKTEVDFSHGRGYIEKDWGKSFPSAYVWMQSNHFDTPGVSLMASIARIPWLGSSFRGFIIGLQMKDRLLRFTTYTGAALQTCEIAEKIVRIVVHDNKYQLVLETDRSDGGLLYAPYDFAMNAKVSETLGANIKLNLYEKSRGLIFSEIGRHAGLDVNGNLSELAS
ncbi:hypothetical protein EH223_10340 [candidate division KSB1 bacterium]|nr:hypothetical protein [candidate division KSB1 bacterium]RQW03279.1 MAG: hypothetical protein EH223_10340 [candidate division KSB1 bacterium]